MKALILVLLFVVPLEAQHEKAADIFSNASVGASIALDAIHSLRQDKKSKALLFQGERLGLTVGITEAVKYFIHRTRPDGSDNKSFYSEHSAIAAASQGWNYKVGFSITVGTASGRVIAKKHYVSDVIVGATVGSIIGLYGRSK